MALSENFYKEIFEKEQKWTESINSNLLNSVYCNLVLKPFYIEKRKELKEEYGETNKEIIKQIIIIINDIIDKIELFNYQYINYQRPDIKTLLSLFLINQMNNVKQKEKEDIEHKSENIDKLKNEKQILQDQINNYNRDIKEIEDYVYDDFPEEVVRRK